MSNPHIIHVDLVRLDSSPALPGYYLIEMFPASDPLDSIPMPEHFVSSGRQVSPLTRYSKLRPGDHLGTATVPLLRVPLSVVDINDLLPSNVAQVIY